jgi:hypothetical protein
MVLHSIPTSEKEICWRWFEPTRACGELENRLLNSRVGF